MTRQRVRHKPIAQINVVPYIDVMLVILIVFMITAPLLTEGLRVDLPEASHSTPVDTQSKEPLVVTVDRTGRYFLNTNQDAPLTSTDLLQKIIDVLRQDPHISILVKGDRSVEYGAVVHLMGLLHQAGAPTVGLITEAQEPVTPEPTQRSP